MVRSAAFLALALGAAVCLGDVARAADASPMVVIYDKAQMLRLAKPARRVIVGNPAIADVSLETPTLMYIFGKTPGETNLIALGDDERPILYRSLVVTTEPSRGVAVHVPSGDGPTVRAYSCVVGRCLRVPSPEVTGNSGGTPAAPAAVGSDVGMPPPANAGAAPGTVLANPVPPPGH